MNDNDKELKEIKIVSKPTLFSAHEEFNAVKIGLKVMKENSPNKIIVGHLNINTLRNKFEALQHVINRNLDIILLSETKFDDSFPSAQLILKGYLDKKSSSGGLLLYVGEGIPSKFLKEI